MINTKSAGHFPTFLKTLVAPVDPEPIVLRSIYNDNFELITPGIRLNIDNKDDQNRIMTPHEAIDNGASKLVIGRSISKAIDPNKALIEIFKSIDSD